MADPAVLFGRLPNGMRYAIMKNATPAGQAVLRLRIGAGSLQERDDQQGLAHFLEHMAFKGSTHVPAGEMVRILQRKGLAFGADTNAATDYGQTVYKLDLPETDGDTVDTGLMLMRETASELTLDAKAFDTERGVILAEERMRDTPDNRATNSFIDLLLEGQRATQRRPIGKVDIIRNAPVDLVADYYRSHYRPDNAMLIVVGDIDPATIEGKIKARFGDWRATAAPPEPDLGAVRPRGLTVRAVEVPGSGAKIQIGFVQPYDAAPDSYAKQRRHLLPTVGMVVLNRRLADLSRTADPPFLRAASGSQSLIKSADVTVLSADSSVDDWRRAVRALVLEQRRLAEFGVQQAELDREIAEVRAGFENLAAGASTRLSVALASSLLDAVNDDTTFTTPANDLAVYDRITKGLKAEEVNAALRAAFGGAGPLVQLILPRLPDGIQAALRTEVEAAMAAPVAAPQAASTVVWPYASFGPAGTLLERKDIADLGLVTARYANNVRLVVKPTQFTADQVLISVQLGKGRLGLPRDQVSAAWAANGFIAGGLEAISYEDMQKALTGVVGSPEFGVEDSAFRLSVTTRPADLQAQLQILAAYASRPGLRPAAFSQTKAAYLAYLPQLDETPQNVLNRDFPALIHSGDPRWGFPTREDIERTGPDDLKKLMMPALAAGPLDVAIVGDVKADDAIRLVAQTFGTLEKRDVAAPPAADLTMRFPKLPAEPIVLTHKGRTDQAIALVSWPTVDLFNETKLARAMVLAGDILQNRLLDQIRISEGATYSVQSSVEPSTVFPGYGYAYSYVETPPAKIDSFFANVERITADLAGKGVTPDELTRVKAPRIERIKQDLQSNTYWLGMLDGAAAEPRLLDLIRTYAGDYEQLTLADVQAGVAALLASRAPLRLVVRPEAPLAPLPCPGLAADAACGAGTAAAP
ncbi:M16 family metallopeptidase [Labrys wisconsinensis]|uniref:Zinc protease n=1 Tax=Labrys wisconsinensis TaxID=425677 RepID=A0ABU0J904_9HYPH|nr:M16 family metallopeptidase [Labrys wisconsinensis]MDQ0469739.1 zinc protease [Labrys wisconsinensis]